ncbi:hypothetical protein HK099_003531 [Clydaea vesicula]|uniref:Serine hydrolase domain-containing protein n=1 Tax=Clydaea vesicula TaxID=447962 RepID=A0AAD5Y089_9FUNG|nr:hypothetical protein HK099_003531 [Clydaea vesicula]KAJ3385734.1 hypothetical protein HDU92_002914 [Lobulomyces angularis]
MSIAPNAILCLHGYLQNANTMEHLCSKLSSTNNDVEFIHVDAPFTITSEEVNEFVNAFALKNGINDEESKKTLLRAWKPEVGDAKTWWKMDEYSFNYAGFEETILYLKSVLENQGPFVGILGFSQGATLASLVTSILENPDLFVTKINHPKLKFSLLFSGLKSRDQKHLKFYQNTIQSPSLHVLGNFDSTVDNSQSMDLTKCYQYPEILRFDGGHEIPDSTDALFSIQKFINENLQ